MPFARGPSCVCLLRVLILSLVTVASAASSATETSSCRALLEGGDRAFNENDLKTATDKWRASISACADPGLDPQLRAKAILRQATLPENANRETSLLAAAERLLDPGNLEQAPLLAEILRRKALVLIGRGNHEGGDAALVEVAELLRARFGEGSPEELNARIELENQRIVLGAQRKDRKAIAGAVESLERILRAQEGEPATDRGVAIALNSALIEGYGALGRGLEADERRLELNRLLH